MFHVSFETADILLSSVSINSIQSFKKGHFPFKVIYQSALAVSLSILRNPSSFEKSNANLYTSLNLSFNSFFSSGNFFFNPAIVSILTIVIIYLPHILESLFKFILSVLSHLSSIHVE
jgi:hypothetical protein